jgi:hypothetical protein
MPGTFAEVRGASAQNPAYRPTRSLCAVDVQRNGQLVSWFRSCSARATAKIASMAPRLPVTGALVDRATWERPWPRFVAVCPGYADYLTRCAPRKPRMFRLHPRA